MKKYIKNNKIKFANLIIVKKNGKQIINPKESSILDDGWIEYTVPEPSEEEVLRNAKRLKKDDIEFYKNSQKGFNINGEEVVIDTETLNKLTFRIMAESAMNKSKTSIWLNDKEYKIKTKDALDLVYNMQVYFGELFDISNRHIKAIEDLNNIEDIESYDHHQDYPDKLKFNLDR